MKFVIAFIISFVSFQIHANSNACLEILKSKMINKSQGFVNSNKSHIDDHVNAWNLHFRRNLIKEFSVFRFNGTTKLISVNHTSPNLVIEYSLEAYNDTLGRSDYTYTLDITLKLLSLDNGFKSFEINQILQVNSHCDLIPSSFEVETLTKAQIQTYITIKETSFYNGEDLMNTKFHVLPEGGLHVYEKYGLEEKITSEILSDHNIYRISHDDGIDKIDITLLKDFKRYSSVINDSLKYYKDIFLGVPVVYGVNVHGDIVFLSAGGNISVTKVSDSLWNRISNTLKVSNSAEVILNENFLNSENSQSIRVEHNTMISFDNLINYWEVLSSKDGELTLKEYSGPIRKTKSSTSKDLEDTEILNINSIEIQTIKNQILSKNLTTRESVVLEILKLIDSKISYDFEMVESLNLRPLSTKEILKREKGVCTHFSVLFVAIARSLGIPSRAVSGLSLSPNKSFNHAWAEYEVAPGYWVPVEPQTQRTRIHNIRKYLPLREHSLSSGINYEEAVEHSKEKYKITSVNE